MRQFILLSFLCTLLLPLTAQEFSGGFRAGLNFNSISGNLEDCRLCSTATSFESLNNTTGFHVGATFALGFTDLFGVKADLMYSQKGAQRRFAEGTPSYFYLYVDDADSEGRVNFATLEAEIDVVNSYIDIPLTAYYKLGKLEIEGGASMGLLVNSRSTGGLRYNAPRFGAEPVIMNIEGSYFSDDAGNAGIQARTETARSTTDNTGSVRLPELVSVYYNNNSNEPLYRRLDFALIGGLNYFLNNGLFVGARYQYGLTDLTKGENDLRVSRETNSAEREYNTDDEDFSRSLLISVGFRF